MYDVYFYEDKKGNSDILEYLSMLSKKGGKDNKIKFTKIQDYIKALSVYGFSLTENYIKHLDGEIWELRPLRDRIFFVAWKNNSFVLLHCFTKKSQKTPKREIEKAKRELKDMEERRLFYED